MGAFAAAVLKWRQTHCRLVVRMLGHRHGTGCTEGVPYLEKVRALGVFTSDDKGRSGGAGGYQPAGAIA